MLRSRFRALTRNQAAVADHSTVQSPFQNQTMPVLFLGGSPRVFDGFLSKFFESKTSSPIFETNLFQTSGSNSFDYARILSDQTTPKFSPKLKEQKHQHSWEKESDLKGISLALTEKNELVLFGSNLKVHQSVREMELSEDYTCVISHHGPNPKTTHIYDNCIVECDCNGVAFGVVSNQLKKEDHQHHHNNNLSPKKIKSTTAFSSDGFLSFCYTCRKDLAHGKDIYIYGGEKSFCSRECRWQEMLFDGLEFTDFE